MSEIYKKFRLQSYYLFKSNDFKLLLKISLSLIKYKLCFGLVYNIFITIINKQAQIILVESK